MERAAPTASFSTSTSGVGSCTTQTANAPFISEHRSISYLRVRTQSISSSSSSSHAERARCSSCKAGPVSCAASCGGIVAWTIKPSPSTISTPITPRMKESRCTVSSIRPCVLTSISSGNEEVDAWPKPCEPVDSFIGLLPLLRPPPPPGKS